MPFVDLTVNIAIAKKMDFRGENLVMIKPSAAKISVYHDAAKLLPVCSCPSGETTLEITNNPELTGEFYIESSIDAQAITINYW
jgi:hypothetical protein